MRLYSVIIVGLLLVGCGISLNDAIRAENVSTAMLTMVDAKLGKEIDRATAGGQELPERLDRANDALQEVYRAYFVLRAGTDLWEATGSEGDWQDRAVCMLDAVTGLEKSLREAGVPEPSEVRSFVSFFGFADGKCVKDEGQR